MSESPSIRVRGVRQNNLKNLSLDIPLKRFIVVTGVSGSGKSSLAFETLYAEGSRRYMESLSTYARQFMEQIPRPEVDTIDNLPPAIALEQRNSITSSRSTVASLTEVHDYLRILFANVGHEKCRHCGWHEVKINDSSSVAENILALPDRTRLYLLAPLGNVDYFAEFGEKETKQENPFLGQSLYSHGFQRLLVDNEVVDLASAEGQIFNPEEQECFVLVDRLVTGDTLREDPSRLHDSLETAFMHGAGSIEVRTPDGERILKARNEYSCTRCGTTHVPPTPALFSTNSPVGACNNCNGFGETLELDSLRTLLFPGVCAFPQALCADSYGRVLVEKPLENIFAAGDCSVFQGKGLNRLSAQAALRKGKLVALNLLAQARGRAMKAYTYQENGYMVSLGRHDAAGWLAVPANVVTGVPAVACKEALESQYNLYLGGVDTYLPFFSLI